MYRGSDTNVAFFLGNLIILKSFENPLLSLQMIFGTSSYFKVDEISEQN